MRTVRRIPCSFLAPLLLFFIRSQELNAFQVSSKSSNLPSSRPSFTAPLRRAPFRCRPIVEREAVELASSSINNYSADHPFSQRLRQFLGKNFFVLGMVIAVSLARAFPAVSEKITSTVKCSSLFLTIIFYISSWERMGAFFGLSCL